MSASDGGAVASGDGDRRAIVNGPSAPSSTAGATGEEAAVVVLLSRLEGSSLRGTPWRLSGAGGEIEIELASDGRVELAPGSWKVDPPEGWVVDDPVLQLGPREERVVWVSREASVSVYVRDGIGRPVAGARVTWVMPPGGASFDPDHDWWKGVLEAEGVTGDDGLATLSDVSCPAGLLRVVAEGFQPVVEDFQHLDPGANEPSRVTLRTAASRGARALRIEDAETGAPIAEARASSEYGELPGRSDEDGLLDLPEWGDLGELLRIRAPGYCPAFVATDDSELVRLFPAARVTVHAVTQDGRDVEHALVRLEIDPPPEGTPHPHVPRSKRLRGTSTFEVEVPLSRELRFRGVAASGGSADATHVPAARDVDLRLEFARQDSLRVDVRPPIAARSASVVATYDKGGSQLDLKPDPTGAFIAPDADDVGSLAIESPGFVATRLKPFRSTDVARSGFVVVELRPAIEADLKVVSGAGEPLPGMRLFLSAQSQPIVDVPDRPGFHSTSHPAWIRQVSALAVGVTDGDGRWRASGIAAGWHRLTVGVDSSQLLDSDGGRTGFPPQTFELELIDGAEEVVTVDPPRRVRIQATRALGGGPVPNLFVRDPYAGSGLRIAEEGSSVDLWVPRSVDVLEVSSEGMEPKLVDLTGDGGSSTHHVELVPSQPGSIALEDPDGLLPAPPFRVHAYARGLHGSLLWHGYLRVDDPARADIHIPLDHAPTVTLELVDEEADVDFEPVVDEWHPAGELRYRVVAD